MEPVSVPLQTELTDGVIRLYVLTDIGPLYFYRESSLSNEALIQTLCGFFSDVRGTPANACPIT